MGFAIQPTVGRVVWYRPNAAEKTFMTILGNGPLAAIVTHVWSDTCVNLTVFDSNGQAHGKTSVTLHQGDGLCSSLPYCEWMPYQKGQAAKTEQLEQKLQGEQQSHA